jgi:hypothetical protein
MRLPPDQRAAPCDTLGRGFLDAHDGKELVSFVKPTIMIVERG